MAMATTAVTATAGRAKVEVIQMEVALFPDTGRGREAAKNIS